MAKRAKTLTERILESARRNGKFNNAIAKKTFRSMSASQLHGTVMRTALRLADNGYLQKKGIGEYAP
jgi:hypothetical protein